MFTLCTDGCRLLATIRGRRSQHHRLVAKRMYPVISVTLFCVDLIYLFELFAFLLPKLLNMF